jgi:hypothetical protein
MDFKLTPAFKNSYNYVFIVINRLSKQAILTPYYKIINIKGIAQIYL